MRWRWLFVAAIVGALVLAAAAEAESEFANPGSIEGTVTKAGGTPLKGVEICAFDVAEDEEFTECVLSKSNGSYEIDGLDEGPYRVEFKNGSSKLNLATQFWKGATSASKATIVRVEEAKTNTGIDAQMQVAPVTTGVLIGGVLEPDVDGDGFGDTTQDRCPQSAAFHTACPKISFVAGYTVDGPRIKMSLKSSAPATVLVTLAVPTPGASSLLATKRAVDPDSPTTVTLTLPGPFMAYLRKLPANRWVPLTVRADATAVEGAPSRDELTVRLRGGS
jgi:hypothetical protein